MVKNEQGNASMALMEPEPMDMAESAAHAVAVQAKEIVRAKYIMAKEFPRNWDVVRQRILMDCARPKFAEKAMYTLRFGQSKVQGESIRFVEAALMAMGNVDTAAPILYDGDDKQIIRVMVTDLERNTSFTKDIHIAKTKQRKSLKRGETPLATKLNKRNQTVYILPADEDEVASKRNAFISKGIRSEGLRLIPVDIREEAVARLRATLADSHAENPDATKRRLLDAFAEYGVSIDDLVDYLGHDLDKMSEHEIQDLYGVYTTLEDGAQTWFQIIDQEQDPEVIDSLEAATRHVNKKKTTKRTRKK